MMSQTLFFYTRAFALSFYKRAFVLCLLAVCLCMPRPAFAAFLFCNKSATLIEAAFGYREDVKWISEGWWQIQPGQCARVYGKPLTQRFYFYYARMMQPPAPERKPAVWAGKSLFCLDNKAFRIEGYERCEKRGYLQQGFQQVDIGLGQKDYTLTFQDGPR